MTTILLALFVLFFGFVIWMFWDYDRRQARALELESRYGREQVMRAREKFRLVRQIGAPECPDGTYSPGQLALWRQYEELDTFDKAMTAWEIETIVGARGYS